MALPISVTYTFATATTAIPLSQLDTNFTTVVNGINGIGNGTNTLSNVVISGGTITGLSAAIPVASGGTGLTSPGTSGNVLTSDGTNWTSSISSFSAVPTIVAFTSSGTFTVPAGVTKVKVTVVGGGGGGRTATNSTSQGGGGAGGAAIKVITGLTPGGTVAVTVGAGGAANTSGVTSSFGSYCSATGGSSPATGGPGGGGAGGTATGGDINFTGGAGNGGNGVNGTVSGTAGNGGSSIFGGAGLGATSTNSANTAGAGAPGTGAGGGGGCGGPGTGGAGGSGIVIVEY